MELLKAIVPHLRQVAVLRESALAAGPGQFGALQAVAPSFGVELRPLDLHDPGGIEHGIAAFAKGSNNGLIVTASPTATLHRNLIILLAARNKLPAVYYERSYVTAGGLISYGSDFLDQCQRAAGYVDRILKGEKPADLPVQAPIKYELVINLKTAKALGLAIPPTNALGCQRGDRMRAARVHHAARRRGSRMAVQGARAAADAPNWRVDGAR